MIPKEPPFWRGRAATPRAKFLLAAGLHLYVTLPDGVDVQAARRAVYERGVLIEDAAPHWADASRARPAIVLGYGSVQETSIAGALRVLGDALDSADDT